MVDVARRRHPDKNSDLFRVDRRIVRHMLAIAQQKLKRVLAGGQGERRLGLPRSEVHVVLVVGDRLVEGRQRGVDDQVVVSGIGFVDAGGRYAHFFQAEADNEGVRHVSAVLRRHYVYQGAGRRLMPLAVRRRGRRGLGRLGRRRGILDGDMDLFGVDRRIVGDVMGIPQQQLQRMGSRSESEVCFGLPGAEMQVVLVVGDRLVEGWQIGVDQ